MDARGDVSSGLGSRSGGSKVRQRVCLEGGEEYGGKDRSNSAYSRGLASIILFSKINFIRTFVLLDNWETLILLLFCVCLLFPPKTVSKPRGSHRTHVQSWLSTWSLHNLSLEARYCWTPTCSFDTASYVLDSELLLLPLGAWGCLGGYPLWPCVSHGLFFLRSFQLMDRLPGCFLSWDSEITLPLSLPTPCRLVPVWEWAQEVWEKCTPMASILSSEMRLLEGKAHESHWLFLLSVLLHLLWDNEDCSTPCRNAGRAHLAAFSESEPFCLEQPQIKPSSEDLHYPPTSAHLHQQKGGATPDYAELRMIIFFIPL